MRTTVHKSGVGVRGYQFFSIALIFYVSIHMYKETSYNHPDVDELRKKDNHKLFLIEFVNSLIRRGNAETMCQPVVTRGVAAMVQDPSIVHKGTTAKLVMSRTKPSLSIFDEVRYSVRVFIQ